MVILVLKGSGKVNFMKKYGLYFAIILVTTVLGTVGYITESRKEQEEMPKEITYVPKLRKEEVEVESAMSKKISVEEEKTASAPSPSPQKTVFKRPVQSEVSNPYSNGKMIYSETMDDFRTHDGEDYVCNVGEGIMSAGDGKITSVYTDDFWGLCIEIEHSDKIITRYCSLGKAEKKTGDKVMAGDIIAISGNTSRLESAKGVHLHFEAERDGVKIDPEQLFKNQDN